MKQKIEVAMGRRLADLVIKNSQIVNVFTQTLTQGDVAIFNGEIVGIGSYEGVEELDGTGKYLAPGLIDAHMHIESSLVLPSEFGKVSLAHGVTALITDPHEIANVYGVDGLKFMLEDSQKSKADIYTMLPSCVPATQFEQGGAVLHAADLKPFYDNKQVLGLAEMMNYPAVLAGADEEVEKMHDALSANKKVDGHGAGLTAQELNAYIGAGIKTDHECTTIEEAAARLERGMSVLIREGSAAKNALALFPIVQEKNMRHFMFCTDDKHLDEVYEEGSIDHIVRMAIQAGIPPVMAITMGSYNAATCYGLETIGAIAPGYQADFVLLNDLASFDIAQVYKNGELVAEAGVYLPTEETPSYAFPPSVNIQPLTKNDLALTIPSGYQGRMIGVLPNSIVTEPIVEAVETDAQHLFVPSLEKEQLKIAVIERHFASGKIGLGIVKGLGLKRGAIATTIAHDSHHLIVCGTSDEEMLFAVSALEEIGGGMVVVCEGKVLASCHLEIAGLLSAKPWQAAMKDILGINEAVKQLKEVDDFHMMLTVSFLALPVIPTYKMTINGLFDVRSFNYVEVAVPPKSE
ncbi:adenine deaminase [Isobaculum melis]|nr:adenine deaminase [Isobaculum melis]